MSYLGSLGSFAENTNSYNLKTGIPGMHATVDRAGIPARKLSKMPLVSCVYPSWWHRMCCFQFHFLSEKKIVLSHEVVSRMKWDRLHKHSAQCLEEQCSQGMLSGCFLGDVLEASLCHLSTICDAYLHKTTTELKSHMMNIAWMKNENDNGSFLERALRLKPETTLRVVPSLLWVQNCAWSTTSFSLQGREVGSCPCQVGGAIVIV